jgi:CDP-diacylglycerol--glycerol-3-phosphate 3-phosphatidyltransferase
MAAPLARRGVQPDILTLWGLALACGVPAVSSAHHRWLLLASALVIVSALTDGVDGCVAGLTGRATARGFVLDSVVDRVSDALFAGALVVAGGASWAAAVAVGALTMLEYLRARAGNAGMGEVGVVTVGERPSRIIATVLGLGAIGISPAHAAFIGTGSLLVTAGVAAVGFVQLAVHIAIRMD